jgi:hypothetical protein
MIDGSYAGAPVSSLRYRESNTAKSSSLSTMADLSNLTSPSQVI